MIQTNLTEGPLFKKMMAFAIPYLAACFLQTFYGMADLFITGCFNGAVPVTAVSIGSQVMHMLTVMIVGLAMGSTISIGHALGAKKKTAISLYVGNTICLFSFLAIIFTAILLFATDGIIAILSTPLEAVAETRKYLLLCFAGLPFIVAYNVIASIFRGLGDTKHPMYFVACAGLINIVLDYILIGPYGMGAAGAAIATILSEAISVLLAGLYLYYAPLGFTLSKNDLSPDWYSLRQLLHIGLPISFQDGLIQISFLIITIIANSRGVEVAAAVGIVEKVIGFLFLVPSAMLSTVAATAAQNAGAGHHERGRRGMYYAMAVCTVFGFLCIAFVHGKAEWVVSLFVPHEAEVIRLGGEYFRSYVWDVLFAGFQFCYSGYFSAYKKSMYSFFHNMVSTCTTRIPLTYAAAILFPTTLYPMGWASPLGSLLSTMICVLLYRHLRKGYTR